MPMGEYCTQLLTAEHAQLETAAELLREGKLVVFPTETVYGIGANALDADAVKGIFTAKGRPQDNPLIVHIAQLAQLEGLVRQVPPAAQELIRRFWPGPLTLILERCAAVPEVVSAGLDTVAVRMPSHPVAHELLRLADVPVAAPSANRSGSPSPTTAQHCLHDLDSRVHAIVDGGPCTVGLESTVITLAAECPRLLRPGAVTLEQLRGAIGDVEVDDAVLCAVQEDAPVASPGLKYKHYAPKAKLILVHGDLPAFIRYVQGQAMAGTYALVFDGETVDGIPCIAYGEKTDASSQAEKLFAALRTLDDCGAQVVYARAPQTQGVGLAVYNRLIRAAAFTEIFLD